MNDILSNLTPAQLEAVTHRDGPMLVIAGAGSGKTRVVTRRIAWLIQQGVWPSQILAMTFTNKAAREMRERVAALTGQAPYNIGTFHGCCARFLRRDIEKLDCKRTNGFTIYDADEQKTLLKQCIAEEHDVPRIITPSLLSTTISNHKNNQCDWAKACPDRELSDFAGEFERLGARYEAKLAQCNALDFDDLLLYVYRLLVELPEMAEIYHHRFRYLLVDEYQDTNHLQYQLIMKLANEERNVHVTGDPDQAIYSWRGADYHNILSFTQDFPDARIVKLEQNYRSTPTILDAANTLIDNNQHRFPKTLFTENPDGVPITSVITESDRAEAEWVRRKIARVHDNGHRWRDAAVFYRTNAQSRTLEEEFVKAGVPYQLLGGIRFYDRKEIKDFLALLRLKVNPSDELAFKRVIDDFPETEGIGPRSFAALAVQAGQAGESILGYLASDAFAATLTARTKKNLRLQTFSAWCRRLLAAPVTPVLAAAQAVDEATGFSKNLEKQYGAENLETRAENLDSFLERAATFTHENPDATLAEFLQDVALVADIDGHDPEADSVVLMTLHSSKGLEFPYVFITGVEEGLLPHGKAAANAEYGTENQEGLEEERRLFYVGITRAQKAVYLSRAATRFQYHQFNYSEPSRFLDELPPRLLKRLVYRNGIEKRLS